MRNKYGAVTFDLMSGQRSHSKLTVRIHYYNNNNKYLYSTLSFVTQSAVTQNKVIYYYEGKINAETLWRKPFVYTQPIMNLVPK